MIDSLSNFIVKYRFIFVISILLMTVFMGYNMRFVEYNYSFAKTVPDSDEDMIYYQNFRKTFGEDGNIFAVGLKDSSIFEFKNFVDYKNLISSIENIEGINGVLGLPNLKSLKKNVSEKRFELVDIFPNILSDKKELDSLLSYSKNIKFYSGQILNSSGAINFLITIDKKILNSPDRDGLMLDILSECENFVNNTGIELRYAGLPYSRYVMAESVKKELNLFLVLSICITALILFFFFRSFNAVLVPLIIIGVVVIWVFGCLAIFDFKITLLTGLLPPLIVVIGIPNCVYMLNKYHNAFSSYNSKKEALIYVIKTIGLITFITNFTTAVGFFVLTVTDIKILGEFGIVAGINVIGTFLVSIIFLPSIYLLLPEPKTSDTNYLNNNKLNDLINLFTNISINYQKSVFTVTFLIILASIFYMSKIESVSYLLDDVPEESKLKKDLIFFESNFSGIMPLEIIIDTKVKKGIQNLKNLKKINQLENKLNSISVLSQPLSMIGFIKAARQSYYNNKINYYDLPNSRDQSFILRYLSSGYLSENFQSNNISSSFVDSLGQKIRISLKVADLGSKKLDSLITSIIKPEVDEIFKNTKMEATITGSTLLAVKGNRFLIINLFQSMFLAFIIISLIMGLLFRNLTMIIISLIPNIIPLIIAAGLMGFFEVPLKPSSALVFSIVFGISVDYSIHFLAKYRNELLLTNNIKESILKTISETGKSMVFTSFILFFGFIIFTFSSFGGTIVLGSLTSIILFIAMITNLTLLPSIILYLNKKKIS